MDFDDIGFVRVFWCRLPKGAVVQAGISTGSKDSFYFYLLVRKIVLDTMLFTKASPVKPPTFAPRRPGPSKSKTAGGSKKAKKVAFATPMATALNDSPDKAKIDFLASIAGEALFPASPSSSTMAVQGSPLVDTSLGEFGSIATFADGEDYKEACNDLEYHEKLINEQNNELEATLKRLQDQAMERNAEAADSPEAAEDDHAAH